MRMCLMNAQSMALNHLLHNIITKHLLHLHRDAMAGTAENWLICLYAMQKLSLHVTEVK